MRACKRDAAVLYAVFCADSGVFCAFRLYFVFWFFKLSYFPGFPYLLDAGIVVAGCDNCCATAVDNMCFCMITVVTKPVENSTYPQMPKISCTHPKNPLPWTLYAFPPPRIFMPNNLHKEPTAITVIKVKTGTSSGRSLSVFVDESGNFEFQNSYSQYFVMAAFITETPEDCATNINRLRYSYLRTDLLPQLPFHAVNNSAITRKKFIHALCDRTHNCRVEIMYCDKRYVHPRDQNITNFYALIAGSLAQRIMDKNHRNYDEIIFIFDTAISARGQAVFKQHIKETLKTSGVDCMILFYPVKHEPCGQIADYYAWAAYRSLAAQDSKHLDALPLKPKLINVLRNKQKIYW
ncbi:MAG: DUF3800 domain-containing protein [Microbacteriaceae bacterium]|nr:DUF3800 domain-containing protein [Microbacteriaceae bacterium]